MCAKLLRTQVLEETEYLRCGQQKEVAKIVHTFEGAWDQYSCVSFPGAYGISIISCTRVGRPAKAFGQFNEAARNGVIVLDQAGRTSFAYSLGTNLLLELPKDWLKEDVPVLYKSELVRAPK